MMHGGNSYRSKLSPVMRGLLRRIERWRHWPTLVLGIAAYVPLLLTHRGKVGADTKTYLYLDPGKLLADAPWLWETGVGLGTVTHQNIGYLWPLGPYYWLMDTIGVPDWVAQRLWLGSIIFFAGLGVRFCLRTLNWSVPGATIAMFAYAFSPYLLDYAARLSVILLPFAGLGWMIGLTVRSLRTQSWRDPALFALVAVTVGGINATSLLLVLIGPALWVPYAIWVVHEVRLRQAVTACARISVLTIVTSVWWVAGLSIQGKYGVPILRYTEAYQVVAKVSTSSELMRGLGYWFFYGKDSLGPWIQAAVVLTEWIPVVIASFAVPSIAVVTGFFTRFRHRAYFVALMIVGLLVSIASHPWESPSPAGRVFKAATEYDSGLAFRSTPRAIPLFIFGAAVLLAASASAVAKRWRHYRVPYSAGLVALILLAQLPYFTGKVIDSNLERDNDIPAWWHEVAADLDANDAANPANGRDTRVYELPGIDFASYSWGNTVDPVTPGLIDRDFAARELIPYGSPASAALLNAFDGPYQENVSDPDAFAPMMQLMGVGEVVLRSDLRTGRYRTPRTRRLWHELTSWTAGIREEQAYGPAEQNPPLDPIQPLEDEMELGTPVDWERPAPVARFAVEDPRPMVRAIDAAGPLLISGDAAGLVNAAGAGLVDADRPAIFSASYAEDEPGLDALIDTPGAELVVTDTNRKQAWRWGSVRENHGHTERIDEQPLSDDVTDRRLEVFDGADWDAFTIAEPEGPATVDATGYGNAVTYTGGDRATLAFDGNLKTAWKVGAFKDVTEDYLQITWPEPVDISQIKLVQTLRASNNRFITHARILFDGEENLPGRGIDVKLGEESRTPTGQVVSFPVRRSKTLRLAIGDTNLRELSSYDGVSEVGYAEVEVNAVKVADYLRHPTDLLDAAGERAAAMPLTYLFRRAASNPEEVVLDDEEWRMFRNVEVVQDRSFDLSAQVRMPTELPDPEIDRLLGVPDAAEGGVTARSMSRLPSLWARAYSALDGDTTTSWQSPVNPSIGHWLEYTFPQPVTVKDLQLTLVTDGQHSVPRAVRVVVDGKPSEVVRLPEGLGENADASCTDEEGEAIYDLGGNERGATTTVPVRLQKPLTGSTVRLVVENMWQECSRDWFGGGPTVLPIGISELSIPGRHMPPLPERLPTVCHPNLLTIDDKPVGLRLDGTVGAALDRQLVSASPCAVGGGWASPLKLTAGTHRLATSGATVTDAQQRAVTGFSIDLLQLRSEPNGAEPATQPAATTAAPNFEVDRPNRLTWNLKTSTASDDPYWIVMGQSLSEGWTLTTEDGTDLGPARLINGFASGWLVDGSALKSTRFTIEWTPQRAIWWALGISAFGVIGCLAIVFWPQKRLQRRRSAATDSSTDTPGDVSAPRLGYGPAYVGAARVRVISPLDRFGEPQSTRTVAVTFLGIAVAGTIACGPILGPMLAVLTAAAMRCGWAWVALRMTAVAALGLSVSYIVVKQALNGYGLGFDWAVRFEAAHLPVLFAISALFCDVIVEAVRAGWRRGVDDS